MASDTAVCETCGSPHWDNEDRDTGQLWCRKCDTWRWFKWPKTGERHTRKPPKPRAVGESPRSNKRRARRAAIPLAR